MYVQLDPLDVHDKQKTGNLTVVQNTTKKYKSTN